jgi:hypothetical protein
MAVGKSGSFELTGTQGITVRVFWSESYTIDSNQSVVSIDKLQVKSSSYSYVTYFPNGSISVGGAKVIEFSSVLGTHNADMVGLNTYVDVKGGGTYENPPWESGNITHNSDGSKTIAIAVDITGATISGNMGHGWRVSGSKAVELTTIPRASTITSVSNVTLGNACSVKWTPLSAAFYYKMGFQLGDWKYSTEVVHPNKTTEYTYTGLTIPLEVANQLPNDPEGTMYVYLHTFSDSAGTKQIGDTSSATFKVTVPDDEFTKPLVAMELSAVNSLPEQFSGLFVQGYSKVGITPSAEGQYGASIQSFSMRVGGVSYGEAEDYTSDYFSTHGIFNVACYATDSRGYTGETSRDIIVIPYRDPHLENVSATRCDANGNENESGTYLKIRAKRSYALVESRNVQKNFCQIRYRYTVEGNSFSDNWDTILAADDLDSDEVVTGPLLNGKLLATTTYRVEVQALDDIGKPAVSTIIIPTDKVYWHRDGARNALGLGKYNEKDNAIDSAWDFYMNGHKVTGLPTPTGSTDAVPLGFLHDYVVEQGTSGIWVYRKWSGGLAELWCSLDATYQNGNVLASTEVSYPFTMTDAVCGVGSLNSYGGNAAGSLPWNLKLAYGPNACRIWVHNSGGGFTSASTVSGSAYIVGRWK